MGSKEEKSEETMWAEGSVEVEPRSRRSYNAVNTIEEAATSEELP